MFKEITFYREYGGYEMHATVFQGVNISYYSPRVLNKKCQLLGFRCTIKVCLEIMDSVTVWKRTAIALNPPRFKSRKYVHLTAKGNVWYCNIQSLRLWKAVTE